MKIILNDDENQEIITAINNTSTLIDEQLKQNKKLLIHCHAGVSRSATLVIGYLMLKEKMTYLDAYIYTKMKRNIVCPNNNFKRQLEMFQKTLKINNLPKSVSV